MMSVFLEGQDIQIGRAIRAEVAFAAEIFVEAADLTDVSELEEVQHLMDEVVDSHHLHDASSLILGSERCSGV